MANDYSSLSRRELVLAAVVAGKSAAAAQGQGANGVRRTVTVPAQPDAINISTSNTAVIVVDMQNDFGAKGGMFDRAGLDISGIQKAIPPTARVVTAARRAGLRVVYLKMAFRNDLSDLGTSNAPNRTRHMFLGVGKEVRGPNGERSRILVRDTWNTDIVPELKPHADDVVMYKHRFSGFFGTELDAVLKRAGVKDLIVTGCTTSVCVESTVRDAMFRDYRCILLADCMAEPIGNELRRTNHEASLLVMQTLFAWVSSSSQLLQSLNT
jgi:ureidoacrylate peracid hydrolase